MCNDATVNNSDARRDLPFIGGRKKPLSSGAMAQGGEGSLAAEIAKLNKQIEDWRDERGGEVEEGYKGIAKAAKNSLPMLGTGGPNRLTHMRQRRYLKGHFGKIYSLHWAGEKKGALCATASQDGEQLVWQG